MTRLYDRMFRQVAKWHDSQMRRSQQLVRSSSVLRAVYVGARRTTLRLEPVMWDALSEIAAERGCSVHDLLTQISRGDDESNLSSAVRVYIVEFYRRKVRRR